MRLNRGLTTINNPLHIMGGLIYKLIPIGVSLKSKFIRFAQYLTWYAGDFHNRSSKSSMEGFSCRHREGILHQAISRRESSITDSLDIFMREKQKINNSDMWVCHCNN